MAKRRQDSPVFSIPPEDIEALYEFPDYTVVQTTDGGRLVHPGPASDVGSLYEPPPGPETAEDALVAGELDRLSEDALSADDEPPAQETFDDNAEVAGKPKAAKAGKSRK